MKKFQTTAEVDAHMRRPGGPLDNSGDDILATLANELGMDLSRVRGALGESVNADEMMALPQSN